MHELARALHRTAMSPYLPLPIIPQMPVATVIHPNNAPPQSRVSQRRAITPPMIQPINKQPVQIAPQNAIQHTHPYNLRLRPRRSRLTMSQQFLCNAKYDESTGKKVTYRQLKQWNPDIWNLSIANKIGRPAQGYKNVKGSNTITFIPKISILDKAKVTYVRIVLDYKPLKDEPYRSRLTVGGDKLPYFDETKTDKASLPIIKTHLNSTISTTHAKYATADIKNFYLVANSPS